MPAAPFSRARRLATVSGCVRPGPAARDTPAAMQSLPHGYRALVVGASGAIGGAFVAALEADPRCAGVQRWHRRSDPPLDLDDPGGVERAAAALARQPPLHLVIVATGLLHAPGVRPEKRLADLDPRALETLFRVNAIGPALLLRHVAPLLDRQRSVMAVLSAKVGSIGDNRLGGWYGYRASKAALNMLLRTASIELRRTHPGAVLAALHPGTVRSGLSRPFRGDEIGREPADAVAAMLATLDGLQPEDSGCFVAYDGERLPW
jgi:NAD(P)-dependent dehydrogenase (short-subunit alcohol dehydrogenase family)